MSLSPVRNNIDAIISGPSAARDERTAANSSIIVNKFFFIPCLFTFNLDAALAEASPRQPKYRNILDNYTNFIYFCKIEYIRD